MHDLAIVGAGPVGATLALALRDADLDIVVLDARQRGVAARDRSLAISHGARLIYERLSLWAPLAAEPGAITPITTIDISQAGGFGAVRLEAAEHRLPALGYVVSYRALQRVLDDALARARIDLRFDAPATTVNGAADAATIDIADRGAPIDARLAAVADGAASSVPGIARRTHDYGQVAIVSTLTLDRPHAGVAYERFTAAGPIALLPERDHYALIWTQKPADATHTLALSEQAFLAALGARFGTRCRGAFAGIGERRGFPLTLEIAQPTTGRRVAVIGNAAQALHPIAGQGFNLGLRDAFELAQIVSDTPRESIGSNAMLERYRRRRGIDRRAGIAFTHGLVHLFANDSPLVRVPRGLGMMLLDTLPFAKRAFTRAMLFGVR